MDESVTRDPEWMIVRRDCGQVRSKSENYRQYQSSLLTAGYNRRQKFFLPSFMRGQFGFSISDAFLLKTTGRFDTEIM